MELKIKYRVESNNGFALKDTLIMNCENVCLLLYNMSNIFVYDLPKHLNKVVNIIAMNIDIKIKIHIFLSNSGI